MIPQRADVITLGDALGQIQHTAVALADAVVAAHGDIAQSGNLLIGTAGLLPGLYQGAVVEINVQLIIGRLQNFHLKNTLSGLGKEDLLQSLQGVGIALFDSIYTSL